MDTLEALLASWRREGPAAAALVDRVADARAGKLHLAQVIRLLLSQRVPVNRPLRILAALEGLTLTPRMVPLAVRAARLALRDQLPGMAPGTRHTRLEPEHQRTLMTCVEGSTTRLLDPIEAQAIIAAAKRHASGPESPAALIVEDWRVALFLQQLLEYEVGDLPILTEEELLPPAAA